MLAAGRGRDVMQGSWWLCWCRWQATHSALMQWRGRLGECPQPQKGWRALRVRVQCKQDYAIHVIALHPKNRRSCAQRCLRLAACGLLYAACYC